MDELSVDAMDAMAVTRPVSTRSVNAGQVMVAVWSTATLAMSCSSTWMVTFILERSAICMSGPVAPEPPMLSDRSVPTCALRATTEPAAGALTVRRAALATASS